MQNKLLVINAGTSEPSSTALLAGRTAARVAELLGDGSRGHTNSDAASGRPGGATTSAPLIHTLNLKPLAVDIAHALTTGILSPELEDAASKLGEADGIIAATPIYKAGASALFSGFFQALDDDLLIGKPVVLAATAGSARHSLVVDQEMRALFAYLRAVVAPTALFAVADDWSSNGFGERIERAATELALLVQSGFSEKLRAKSWGQYQHSYGSAGGKELSIDLNSDLMRLATGG